jgi:hypothetical protein
MSWSQLRDGNFLQTKPLTQAQKKFNHIAEKRESTGSNLSRFVGGEGVLGVFFAVGAGFELGQVPVVIALHLEIEDLGLGRVGGGEEMGVEQAENAAAYGGELGLDLGTVLADECDLVGVVAAELLLQHPPGRAAGADFVLVGHGQQVALLHAQLPHFVVIQYEFLQEVGHIIVALRLLGHLRHVHVYLAG